MLRALASRWLLYADVWPADTSGKRLDSAWLSRADAEHKTAEALKESDFVLFCCFFFLSSLLFLPLIEHWSGGRSQPEENVLSILVQLARTKLKWLLLDLVPPIYSVFYLIFVRAHIAHSYFCWNKKTNKSKENFLSTEKESNMFAALQKFPAEETHKK